MTNKAAELQREVRENADDYQNYLKSLYQWEEEIKVKDEALKKATKKPGDQEFPIRGQKAPVTPIIQEVTTDSSTQHQDKQRAIIEKNKGNDFFKDGKYELAVKHYTAAISLDPSDAILPANRAIAYLKLNQFAEAEEDCNNSIKLDPSFVKAYHRRGMARASTGRTDLARKDFEKVLSLEPHNKAAQQELDKLNSTKPATKPSVKKSVGFADEKRVEEPLKASKVVRHVKKPVEVALEHPALTLIEELNPAQAESTEGPSVSIPIVAVADDKQERIAIERIVGQLANQKKEEPKSIPKSDPAVARQDEAAVIPPVPRNYVQFVQDWKRLGQRNEAQYQYLKQIPPAKLPQIFRESLESDVLAGILSVLRNQFLQRFQEPILPWLSGLCQVARITAVILFLTPEQTSDLKSLLDHLAGSGEGTEEERKMVAQKLS